MPTQAEMAEVTKLIEARLDSRYTRDNGVVEDESGPTWSGDERVIESIDGNLGWRDLSDLEQKAILEFNVTWEGFTPEQELDVIGNVLMGDPPEDWMNGVMMDRMAQEFDASESPRGWETWEANVEQVDYRPSPRAANDNERGQER